MAKKKVKQRPRTAARDIAEQVCREMPDVGSLTIGKRLRNEYSVHFASVEAARSMVRTIRGNNGRGNRRLATQPRPNSKAGAAPKLPPSQAEDWKPFKIAGPERIFCISDCHVPYHSQVAMEAAVKFGEKFKPTVVLLNGDHCDFYSISRWEKDPSKRRFVDELEQCERSFEWLRSRFPSAKILLKYGNHEERYDHFVWQRAPEFWGVTNVRLAKMLHLDEYGIEPVADKRIIQAGNLAILHGHEAQFSSGVNQARGAFLKLGNASLTGHGHKTSTYSEPDLYHRETQSWSQGCLCDLAPEYARINKWNHGFATIEIDKNDQDFELQNYRIIDGKVKTA